MAKTLRGILDGLRQAHGDQDDLPDLGAFAITAEWQERRAQIRAGMDEWCRVHPGQLPDWEDIFGPAVRVVNGAEDQIFSGYMDELVGARDELADLWPLREEHRSLSEAIVEGHRMLARLATQGGADAALMGNLRRELSDLHSERTKLDSQITAMLRALKVRSTTPATRTGLVKVRHLNRDFFLADLFDYALKDDGASMEAPIFTLSTKPDLSIWEWNSRDGNKSVRVTPSVLGRATQHDKDVLIYVVSQLTEALNRGRDDAQNRTVRFTVYDFLVTTNRGVSGDDYQRLQQAFERLRGTSITTDIRTGGERVRQGFGIIDEWRIIEKSPTDERMIAVEVTLSRWLYNAVQAFEVLTIHPDYFRLRKPLARRLYEIARKHCGHQTQWTIGLDLLQGKTGSKSTLREFRRALRAIEEDDSLPEYRMILSSDDKVTFYRIAPQCSIHSGLPRSGT